MSPPATRLFFALWPAPDVAQEIDAGWAAPAHAHCGGRRMRPDTLHLTLAFLGNVDPGQVAPLKSIARALPVAPGTIRLERYGRFDRPGVVWAGPAEADAALLALHAALWQALAPLGYAPTEPTYRPHVTLLRNTRTDPPDAPAPLVWHYDRCVLVQSDPGGQARYHVLAHSGG